MMKGMLWKSTEAYVGGTERRFCVLVGTLMLDFESADDFAHGVPAKAEGEVIGVSVWRGKGRPRGAHGDGFVYVTSLGHTNYCSASSLKEHDEWMSWMRTALDMALGTEGAVDDDGTVTRHALHRGMLEPPKHQESEVCMKSGVAFGLTSSRYHCTSCGRVFVQEYCSRRVPVPHLGFEQAVRVCDDCLAAQQLLAHLRFLACTLNAHLHQHRLARRGVRAAVLKTLARGSDPGPGVLSSSLQVGLDLLENDELSEEEFNGLVKAEERFQKDEAYNRVHAGCLAASARLGDSTLAVVGILHRGAAAAPSGDFRAVVMHLRVLAARDLDSIDFFWPQVLHAFYLLVPTVTSEGIFKAELLEDFILSMALRSTHLALKLVWWLKGYVEDLAAESAAAPTQAIGRGAAGKQAHLVRLAVEAEDVVLARANGARHARHESKNNRRKAPNDRKKSVLPKETAAPETREELPPAFERRLLKTLVNPTAAQSSLVADQLLLLKGLRAEAARHLGLDYEAKTLFLHRPPENAGRGGSGADAGETESWGSGGVGAEAGLGEDEFEELGEAEREARYFEEQLSFVQALVDIAERLRFVEPVTARGDHLKQELRKLDDDDDDADGREGQGETPEIARQHRGQNGDAPIAYRGWRSSRSRSRSTSTSPVPGGGRVCSPNQRHASGVSNGHGDGSVPLSPTKCPRSRADAQYGGGGGAETNANVNGARSSLPCFESAGGHGRAARTRRIRTSNRTRGYLPVCRASDPVCPILRIPPEEGHVFKTKARAPTLITCEVLIPEKRPLPATLTSDGIDNKDLPSSAVHGPPPSPAGGPLQSPAAESATLSCWKAERSLSTTTSSRAPSPSALTSDSAAPSACRDKSNAIGAGSTERVGDDGEGRSVRAEESTVAGCAQDSAWAGDAVRMIPLQAERFVVDSDPREGEGGTRGPGGGEWAMLPPTGRGRVAGESPVSTVDVHRRIASFGSDREEVEELIGSQVEGKGNLGRSISEAEGRRRSCASLPPTPPVGPRGYRPAPSPLGVVPPGPGGVTPPNLQHCAKTEPLKMLSTQKSPKSLLKMSLFNSGKPAGMDAPCREPAGYRGAGKGGGTERAGAGDGGLSTQGGGRAGGNVLNGESSVYPEVMEAVGLVVLDHGIGSLGGDIMLDEESITVPGGGGGDGGGQLAGDGVDERKVQLAAVRRNSSATTSSSSTLALDEDMLLPEPLGARRERGQMTSDEQMSEVTDVLRSKHHGHRLLRHSPLGKTKTFAGGSGSGSAGGGVRAPRSQSPRRWGDDGTPTRGGDEDDIVSRRSAAGVSASDGCETRAQDRGGEGAGAAAGGGVLGEGGGTGGRSGTHLDVDFNGQDQENRRAADLLQGTSASRFRTDGLSNGGAAMGGGGVENGEWGEGQEEGMKESAAVAQAKALLAQGLISAEELEAVVQKDLAFNQVVEEHAFLDVQFCVSQAFGESWASKRARIKGASKNGEEAGWDLVSIIVKSNDDLRQEVCALQLIGLCQRIFAEAQLDLFLQPYVIVSTGSNSGLVQCLTDAISMDALKKNAGFVSLRDHFERTYGDPTSKRFLEAQRNFVNSLAAYSLASYVLQIKDRHNGNILLDAEGRLIHIDFGFILGMAPGGNFALETCPFKLPTDYVHVMGGLESQAFMDLVVAFTCGFLTLQAHAGRLTKLLSMMTQRSPFPCFQGKDPPESIVKKLNERLMPHLDKSETVAFCLDLIRESYNNYGQRQFDYYQWLTNGIVT